MISNTIQNNIEINFPYLHHGFTLNKPIKQILLMNFFPYMLAPNNLEEINQYKLPISFKTMKMILDENRPSIQKKYICDSIDNVSPKNKTSDYYAYKCEYDEFQKLGGFDSLLYEKNWASIQDAFHQKSLYFFGIYAIIKNILIKFVNNDTKNISYKKAFCEVANQNNKFYEYVMIANKGLEETVWKNFKHSAHLIYGYIEALYANDKIPNLPLSIEEIYKTDKKQYITQKKNFISTTLGNILSDAETNAKIFNDVIGYSLYAQKILLSQKHKNNPSDFYKFILPEEKIKTNYKIKPKAAPFAKPHFTYE